MSPLILTFFNKELIKMAAGGQAPPQSSGRIPSKTSGPVQPIGFGGSPGRTKVNASETPFPPPSK